MSYPPTIPPRGTPEHEAEIKRLHKQTQRQAAKYSVQDQREQATNPHAGKDGPDWVMWCYISFFILAFIVWLT